MYQETTHIDRQRRMHDMKSKQTNNIVHPDDSILHTEWIEPDRPYSQKELTDMEEKLYTKLQVDKDVFVKHEDCGHYYRVKKNGVRYKQLLSDPTNIDVGNCSVCWKITKTPRKLSYLVDDFVSLHNDGINSDRKSLYTFQINKIFYTWLYNEFYR